MSQTKYKITTILLAVFSGIISVLFFYMGIHDNDYLWHIKTGDFILENGYILKQDIFSWIGNELQLKTTMHSWGFDLLISLLHKFINNPIFTGMIYCFITGTILNYLIGRLFYKEHSLITLVFSFFIGFLSSNPRPQNIGNMFFVGMIYILTKSFHQHKWKGIYLLPIISVLWANIHGGTLPILFAFEGLFFFLSLLPDFSIGNLSFKNNLDTCVINLKYMKDNFKTYIQYPIKLLFVLISSMLSGLINPYNWKLYIYFFITNNEATKQFVNEWQPASLNSIYTIIVLILLFIPFIFFKEKISLEYWILPCICFCLGAIHLRILVYGILAALPIFTQIQSRFSYKKNPYTFKDMLSGILCFTFIFSILIFSIHKEYPSIPKEIITTIKENQYERLYNTYNDGAELIYYNIPCFIDSRADLYPGDLLEDAIYFDTSSFKKEGEMNTFLETYHFDSILLSIESAATIEYLSFTNEWNRVLSQDGYILFEKNQ